MSSRRRAGIGGLLYWPSEESGIFLEGGPVRFLAGAGVDWRRPVLASMVDQRWGGGFLAKWQDERFSIHLEENPQAAKRIIEKCIVASRAREAALRAAHDEPPKDRLWFFRDARWRCLMAARSGWVGLLGSSAIVTSVSCCEWAMGYGDGGPTLLSGRSSAAGRSRRRRPLIRLLHPAGGSSYCRRTSGSCTPAR